MEVVLLQLLVTHLQRQDQVGAPHQLCKSYNDYGQVHKKLYLVNLAHHQLSHVLQHLIQLHQESLGPKVQGQHMIDKLRMDLVLDLFRNLNFEP